VIATDIDPLAPGLYTADVARQIPPVDSDEFAAELTVICEEHASDLLIPTIDPEPRTPSTWPTCHQAPICGFC
jgi:carbamoyl-phosphate synthase large subunit